jgi:hypothetical protein
MLPDLLHEEETRAWGDQAYRVLSSQIMKKSGDEPHAPRDARQRLGKSQNFGEKLLGTTLLTIFTVVE